nr:CoA-binding protein [Candidatus Sigynarchaeota archaeon]
MDRFFNPSSIAIFGASASPGKAGYNITWNLRNAKVPNGIYPINPNRDKILGFKAYASMDGIPASARPVDLTVICLPPRLVLETVKTCIHDGVKAIIIESGQIGETDTEHAQNTKALRQLLTSMKDPPRIMGPNSIGVVNMHNGVNTSLIPFESLPAPEPKGVAIAGQTGLIASGYLQRIIAEKTFPVSKICCLGNKLDVNELDAIEYLANDADTGVIAMYLENIKDGKRFLSLVRDCNSAKNKPIVLVKAGRTEAGAKAVQSHTESIAGDDRVFNAAVRACGAVRVLNFEELWAQSQFFSRAGLPQGNKIGVISITGAGCALTVDAADMSKVATTPLPDRARARLQEIYPSWFSFTNPVDLWAAIEQQGSTKAWSHAIQTLLESEYDAVVIVTLAMPESLLDWDHLERMRKAHPEKPIIFALLGGHANMVAEWKELAARIGIPIVNSPDTAIQVLSRAWELVRWRESYKGNIGDSGKR